jgi:electron transfer flavoprotein beta subunit
MRHAVCLKWVNRRPELDPSGAVHADDARFAGVSPADQAALELALRSGGEVTAVMVGPRDGEAVLREALAAGAAGAVRVDAPAGLDSAVVATALAPVCREHDLVWCGDYSLDRGTGSVPAFLAALLGWGQALGLVAVTAPTAAGPLEGVRRLDGGRRERLSVPLPAVVSVEGSTARLRRASLASALTARTAPVEVIAGPHGAEPPHRATRPFRPRARVVPPPAGATALERVVALTQAPASSAGEIVALDPEAAADRILEVLTRWGYLAPD